MLSDLTTSIKASLYERAISPLFGAFVLSWIAWNYRFILILSSNSPIQEKFEFIDKSLYPSIWEYLLQGAAYPLVTAVTFIFVYPIPAKKIYEYWHKKQQEMLKLKMSIEEETPLSLKESRRIKREILKTEASFDEELSRKNSEIDRLKMLISDLEAEIDNHNSEKPKKVTPVKASPKSANWPPQLDENEIAIMDVLSKAGGKLSESHIVSNFEASKVKTKHHLDELVSKKLIKYIAGDYLLTPAGRKFAADTGLVT
ncbi:MAG: hypothetical protein AB2712_15515 [Candidatus Thiodiazotropha sp.]